MLETSVTKTFYIVTEKEKDISQYIVENLGYGVTVVNARGGYTNVKKKVLMCAIPTKQYLKYILMIVLITIIVYLVLTSIRLYKWSTDNQFNIFNDKSLSNQIDNLNESKIRGIGANVQSSIDLNFNNGKDEQYSVGFAVWRQTQYWLGQIFAWNIEISFIIGLAIVIGYLKLNGMLS